MTLAPEPAPRVKGYLIQCLMLISINVPTVSFGLAVGWVSLASGAGGAEGAGGSLVGAAAATFLAGLAGVPLGLRALRSARRPALAYISAAFAVSWALTLAGGWCVVAGRLCAGAAGAAAWCLAPLLGKEVVAAGAGGAAAAAPVLAHNLGMLLMYVAAYTRLSHSEVVWACLALSALHSGAALLAPESPVFLAATGRHEEAGAALARLRGLARAHPALAAELRALPPPEPAPRDLLPLTRDLLSDRRRRHALLVSLLAVAGQEACGVLSVLQFAERLFLLAGEEEHAAALALGLGAAQLLAAALALYLVERVGRRPLVVWGAVATGLALAAASGAAAGGGARWAGLALAVAVAADSLGLQPAPYAVLADMFHYQYRALAAAAAMCAASAAGAAETALLPALAAAAGLAPALAASAALTLAYALLAFRYIPETRNRTPEEIYDVMCPQKLDLQSTHNNNNKLNNFVKEIGDGKVVPEFGLPADKEKTLTKTESGNEKLDLEAGHIEDKEKTLDEEYKNHYDVNCKGFDNKGFEDLNDEKQRNDSSNYCKRMTKRHEICKNVKDQIRKDVVKVNVGEIGVVSTQSSNELCSEKTQWTNL